MKYFFSGDFPFRKLGNLPTSLLGWAVGKMGIQVWDLFPGAVADPPLLFLSLATAYI